MKYVNIALYAFVMAIAFAVVGHVDIFTGNIPLLYKPFGFEDAGMDEYARASFAFWVPVCGFLWNFAQLLLPAGAGVLILYFAEKKVFTRQATMQKNIAPIWIALAVTIAMVGCPTYFQRGFIYGSTILFGLYSIAYQLMAIYRPNSKRTGELI